MFGYVVIDKPNILIKDYNTYRSYYCGLCKNIGKNQGQFMRFTVNYDIVLLSLLAHNYEEITPSFSQQNCILHPMGKKVPVANSEDIFNKISQANIILGYYKVLDDIIDEKKLRYRLLKFFIKPKYKRAKRDHQEFCKVVEEEYNKLRELEQEKCTDMLLLADCFGEIMIALARTIISKVDDNLISLCYNLGKWIYLIDAYDDIREDVANDRFNPFVADTKRIDATFFGKIDKEARYLLYTSIDKIITSYDKMNIRISEGALSNIIYLGLKARTELVLKRGEQKCKKIRL